MTGLHKDWWGRVYVNPPYSTGQIGKWLAKMAAHDCGAVLIFARTETTAFFEHVWERASGLLFLKTPRLHFHYPDGERAAANCGAPIVICAYGHDELDRLSACSLPGAFVPLRFPRGIVAAALDMSWREALLEWIKAHDGRLRFQTSTRRSRHTPRPGAGVTGASRSGKSFNKARSSASIADCGKEQKHDEHTHSESS